MTAISRVAHLREQAGLTQAQLAVLVGVTTNTIQNWERGSSGVDQILKFLKLCEALGCQLGDLIDITPETSETTKAGEFSLQDLRKLREKWEGPQTQSKAETLGSSLQR